MRMDAPSARFGPWLGGAILLGLVALMVGVAAVRGTVVAGRPMAQPVPAPPEPGDCLVENPFAGDVGFFSPGELLPSWRTGRCAGARYGEVVGVGAGVRATDSAQIDSWEQCWKDAHRYLGLPDPATPGDRPFPAVNLMAMVIGPDLRQRGAGQAWSACVAHPFPPGPGVEGTVDHSLRDAWSRSADRRLLALCLGDGQLFYPVDCRERHGAEQISSWSGRDPAGPGQLDVDACRQGAVVALGSSAALDRGDLGVLALPTRWNVRTGQQITGPDAVTAGEPYDIACLLVPADPARLLVGPLRELGGEPVPFG